jgi:uncharacterized membrane protein (DUF485 family)
MMKLKKKKEKKTLRANSKMPKHFIAIATLKCYVLYIYMLILACHHKDWENKREHSGI